MFVVFLTHPHVRAVDVASIDRRCAERQTTSVKRVDSLVTAFRNSRLHFNTMAAIDADMRQTPRRREPKAAGPSYHRVLLTILK